MVVSVVDVVDAGGWGGGDGDGAASEGFPDAEPVCLIRDGGSVGDFAEFPVVGIGGGLDPG